MHVAIQILNICYTNLICNSLKLCNLLCIHIYTYEWICTYMSDFNESLLYKKKEILLCIHTYTYTTWKKNGDITKTHNLNNKKTVQVLRLISFKHILKWLTVWLHFRYRWNTNEYNLFSSYCGSVREKKKEKILLVPLIHTHIRSYIIILTS